MLVTMLPILIMQDSAPESEHGTPLEESDAETDLYAIWEVWELSRKVGRRARGPLGQWVELRHTVPSVMRGNEAAPASLQDCDQFLKLLVRRRADSLGRRERAELRRFLRTPTPAPSSIATLSPETATWLLWAMSWRGVSSSSARLSSASCTDAHRSMVDQHADDTVLRSCGSASAGARGLRRAAVPGLGTGGQAHARLGRGFTRSADGQNQIHAADAGYKFRARDRQFAG